MERRPLNTTHDLRNAIEDLFPYVGSMDRAFIERPWDGHRISATAYALRAKRAEAESRLLAAMLDCFVAAKRALGNRDDVGIMWRREPFLVTEDDGQIVLHMRCAIVDEQGQLAVSCLPTKPHGAECRSID